MLGALPLPVAAFAEDQTKLFLKTDDKNRKGSDDSLQHSTAYAMTALMDLGNLNIPSAVNNGMTAYGKYRNSETMDRLGDENLRRAASMASAGTSAVGGVVKTDTTFRRLDPSFLRQGKFAKVASEFEKRSGMPRDTFLSQMSEISEKKIKRSDPQLVDKVLGRFESFISKIPNPEFKANLQKGVEMVPATTRTGLISKAVAKFANMTAGAPGGSDISAGASTAPEVAAAAPASAEPVALPAEAAPASTSGDAPRDPASTAAFDPIQSGSPLAESDDKNPLGNIVLAAIDTQGQDISIFQQITRKYRTLTPALVKAETP